MKRKKCKVCNKSLSYLNKSDKCFCHQEHPKYRFVPITSCTSYDSLTTMLLKIIGLKPGCNAYNDFAFNRELDFGDK